MIKLKGTIRTYFLIMPDSNLTLFDFQSNSVRVADIKGNPWFVAVDICRILEIENSRQAVSRLDEDEKDVITSDTLGGNQELAIISESGMWSLVLTSHKLEAKSFKKWVASEVLPSIRKTGKYEVKPKDFKPDLDLALFAIDRVFENVPIRAELLAGLKMNAAIAIAPQIASAIDSSRQFLISRQPSRNWQS